ncbi:TPA: CpaF family protein [Vibrio campbellii]|uniref:Type II/IV secretion system ATP hydrolase TadA/VirB11/CpaF, TadA subfamily n=3 Tax=Vibrio TaxID=662 RepID=A0AAU9Q8Y3_9VIBR|nr:MULTISPECIES: CpaF family protein [Vibrio]CAH1531809.1 Type II/IV secretion system ATP hydrolase TadA/VirB11/CpaF, TadA subfamily [Vibrio owensii]APX08162.1 pilus assembly protein CpaF [Vibrio campbellii]ARR09670.1 type II/IV secretion system ATP hydrolase TadA/VirB11/CpaF, TadA subfamily [Vibrio campbellii]AUW06773.1 CpaF family protein [Vibrio campbellii]NDJ80865.1 CpaF family protein [Vibrio sp. LB10LO1]
MIDSKIFMLCRKFVLDNIDITDIQHEDDGIKSSTIYNTVNEFLSSSSFILTESDRQKLTKEVKDDIFGYGPLEDLLGDNTISDIMVNSLTETFVERNGKISRAYDVVFQNEEQVLRIAKKIVSPIGRRIDESSPMVDARLPDGSRVNIIVPPIALDGCSISIRKFREDKLDIVDLVRYESMTEEMALYLSVMVRSAANIIISGGTGSGKTTLLNACSNEINEGHRVVTIEDAAELQLQHEHVVRLESRPASSEESGEVSIRSLVINSLRMRPDRIIVGECRGDEAFEMLQAMNTGHDGSMSTIHSNNPKDALIRLESMIMMTASNLSPESIKKQISQAVDIIIQTSRLIDGRRKITHITEVGNFDGGVIATQDLFVYDHKKDDHVNEVKSTLLERKVKAAGLENELALVFTDV